MQRGSRQRDSADNSFISFFVYVWTLFALANGFKPQRLARSFPVEQQTARSASTSPAHPGKLKNMERQNVATLAPNREYQAESASWRRRV
jgi:hypothetical protein